MGFLDPNFIPKPTIFYDSKARFFSLWDALGGLKGAILGVLGGLWVVQGVPLGVILGVFG